MKIERVDDKTVKCFLSNEELEEYDIDYKDFIMRSEKAKEVVQEIIVQAEEKVGYKPPKFAFDLQIMMLPDQGLILTFSEKDPSDVRAEQQFAECLQEMKRILQDTKEKLNMVGDSAQGNGARQLPGEGEHPEYAVFCFGKMGDIMEYASMLPKNLRVQSKLYKMGEEYFIYVQKGSASYQRYSKACIQALEFGWLYAASEDKVLYLEEHGECLIGDKALNRLRQNVK